MQGPTVTCDECNATIPLGGKYRQTAVSFHHQKVSGIHIGIVTGNQLKNESATFDLCGDRCLLKHISRLLSQGV